MANDLKVKVCGMREPANIDAIVKLGIDYIGFIFYPKSPRFITHAPDITLTKNVKRVGVFVNEGFEGILSKVKEFNLDAIQLHGHETVDLCKKLKEQDLEVIKVHAVSNEIDSFDFSEYNGAVDAFLFDSKTKAYGGSGTSFDWKMLEQYSGQIPFFLSGGIGPNSIFDIKSLNFPALKGIDLNSCFETRPGFKSLSLLKSFLNELRS